MGKQWKQCQTIFLGSKITADGDCSHEIKRHLLLGRKVMTNLDSILKSRDITLLTKVRMVKALVFPVVIYGCESWTVKKAECRRIDAFELWCWRRLLRALWTERRSNQSILKEISLGCSLEGLMLKLKLQYFGHLMRRVDSQWPWCWEGLGAGGEGDDRGWDGWMASLTRWAWVWVNSGSWWWTGTPGVLRFMGLQSQTWLRDWTELNCSLPGSSVQGILQARILEWVPFKPGKYIISEYFVFQKSYWYLPQVPKPVGLLVNWHIWPKVKDVVVIQLLSSVWLFVTPWTAPRQAPLSMRFPRQEYWTGLPLPSRKAKDTYT